MNEVTRVLDAIERGDPQAADKLLPLVYDQLRRLAAQKLAQERPGQTLVPTALVHEAYMRLVSSGGQAPADAVTVPGKAEFQNRGHFFAAAAEAMRRILVENARRKKRVKHGGEHRRVDPVDVAAKQPESDDDLLALDEALTKLAGEDAVAARVVELRQFAGLGHEDIAATLNITVYQARQKWTYARAWLRKALDAAG